MSLSNNDVLRRFRYALNLNDGNLAEAFALAKRPLERDAIARLLKHETDPDYSECPDEILGAFLDGFIIIRRGLREEMAGKAAPASSRVNNNDILKKIRIALQLREEDLVAIMAKAGVTVSGTEISALFRQRNHPKFKLCGDQFLRNFLTGLETWRPSAP